MAGFHETLGLKKQENGGKEGKVYDGLPIIAEDVSFKGGKIFPKKGSGFHLSQ
jgi:hypothetical protein